MPLPSAGFGDRALDGPVTRSVVDLDVGVVARIRAAVLDVPARLEAQRRRVRGQGHLSAHGRGEVVALSGPPLVAAVIRGAVVGHHRLLGQGDHQGLRSDAVVVLRRAELEALVVSGRGRRVVQPAQLQLVPRAEIGGVVADALVALRPGAALRHQRPPLHRRAAAGGGVVLVREPEVVAVLVEEDAASAVFRLHRVVADPKARAGDLGAAEQVVRRAGEALLVLERIGAVRPDRVLALDRVTVGLVAARVHDLEVIEIAVRLVEVAVVVVVVAVPLVEGRQFRGDVGQ